jgi:(p)ppGpp synthase/HD superfamily hydrolase
MSDLFNVLKFAEKAHEGQVRKYGNRPYILHPIEVMVKVSNYLDDVDGALSAALLHDTIEDCNITKEQLEEKFGKNVAAIVMELTQPDKLSPEIKALPRKQRHQLLLEKLKKVSYQAKIIKMADRLCNLLDSDLNNDECRGFFKRRYLQESWDIYRLLAPYYPSLGDELGDVVMRLAEEVGVQLQ